MAPRKQMVKSKNGSISRREVSSMIRSSRLALQEMKRFSDRGTGNVATAGVVVDCSQPLILGDTIQSRTGDKVFSHKIDINVSLINPAANLLGTTVRVILFRDNHNTGVIPTVAQLLDGSLYNSTYTVIPAAQGRFKIIMDQSFELANGVHMAQESNRTFKLKGSIQYNGDTNVVTANGPGSIWFLVIGSPTTATTFVTYDIYTSIHFTDA